MRKLPRLVVVVILITVVLALPRFAHHTPDSKQYVNLAKYFRGDLPRERLRGPFAYRILVPFLAATLPSDDLDLNFALINVLATILAYLIFIPYLNRFAKGRTDLNVGMLLLVVSFPSFNYASGLLSDPAGFLICVIAAYLLVSEHYLALSAALSLGVLARESLLTMVAASFMYMVMSYCLGNARNWKKVWTNLPLVSIPPIIVFLVLRAYFSDVPNQGYWGLSGKNFVANLTRPTSWLTFLLTLGPPVLLFLIGFHHSGLRFVGSLDEREARLLISIALANVPFVLYGIMVYGSGRYAWPLYTALIPIAVLSSNKTKIFTTWLGPIANRILGGHESREIDIKSST